MKLGHVSDLHGRYQMLEDVEMPDAWVITGDFFPNKGRGPAGRIERDAEVDHQLRWWRHKGPSIMRRLGGRPVLWVGGNHDFVNLAALLRVSQYEGGAFDVADKAVDLGGHRFAGFREVPYMNGEWVGEAHDLSEAVSRAMDADPTVLLTHAPPAGILDDDGMGTMGHGGGVSPLTSALTWLPHRIVAHLFGHIHAHGGRDIEELGVRFYNGAEHVRIVEI
jgi:Icc-related predicted phosphoesterase